MAHVISPDRLNPQRSAVMLVDLQEKLCPAIDVAPSVIQKALVLTDACDEMDIPRAATVQYRRGLGELVQPLNERYPEPFEKLDFSAAACREPIENWQAHHRDQILLVGIETHICILQTALDLAAEGKQPHVILDLVASRNKTDHRAGIERMRGCGIKILTLESVLFEWLGSSRHESFQCISSMVKNLDQARQC